MIEYLGIKEFESYSTEYILENLNIISKRLIYTLEIELSLKPLFPNTKTILIDNQKLTENFNFEVSVSTSEDIYLIKINQKYKKFIKYILLREIYYVFIPFKLRRLIIIHATLNQIILNKFENSETLNEWKSLIRENFINNKDIVKEDNFLLGFNRLDAYFNPKKTQNSLDAIKFFINYLRNNSEVVQDSVTYIQFLFFEEFKNYISTSLNRDEILETIRCITLIFKKVKSYRNLLQYKTFFQVFKENGEIISNLSLRKFSSHMNWVKKYTYIAPSYQLNWHTINVNVLIIFLTFNPLLHKKDILNVMTNFPFFTAPKISGDSFSIEISGYVVIPREYVEDFLGIIKKFKLMKYLIDFKCLVRHSQDHMINLNYFKDFFQKKRFVNYTNKEYDMNYEIELDYEFGDNYYSSNLDYLDLTLLDRIRWFSVSGFGFERRSEALKVLESDLISRLVYQRRLIANLKKSYQLLYESDDFEITCLNYIQAKKSYGIFKIRKELKNILNTSKFIEILTESKHIDNLKELIIYINQNLTDTTLEEIILIKKTIRTNNELFLLFFDSNHLYKSKLVRYNMIYDLLNTLYELRLFDLNEMEAIIQNKEFAVNFINKKEKLYNLLFEEFNSHKITNQDINRIFEKLLKHQPPIIEPLLINTFITKKYVNDFLQLILVNSQDVRENIREFKRFFPRTLINYSRDLITNQNLIYVEVSIPELNNIEKFTLFSIIYNLFQKSIIYAKNLFWGGVIEGLRTSKFYDFENKNFYYSPKLYEQYLYFAYKTFGKNIPGMNNCRNESYNNCFYSDEDDFLNLIKSVNSRVMKANVCISKIDFNLLADFHQNLTQILLDNQTYTEIKNQHSFKHQIKSIEFIPCFQTFGLNQYYIYIYPYKIDDLNIKTLLGNNFQSLEFSLSIGNSNSLIIKYISNSKNPDLHYLHQLKKMHLLREYSWFKIKKFYDLLQFRLNISPDDWIYDNEKFKLHIQNILHNPEYDFNIGFLKEYELSNSDKFDNKNMIDVSILSQVYSSKSIDIKSYLGTNKVKTINTIIRLLENESIYPYLTLKNINLDNSLTILIPGLTEELKMIILRVICFFNIGRIYEIEGAFYINGFKNEKMFKKGLYINIFFPNSDLSKFVSLFDLLFEILEISEYLIFKDLVKGNMVIKRIFGNDFLKFHNPLKSI